MAFLEKTLTDGGEYEVRLNGRLLFVSDDNATIKFIGESIINISEADDCATLVIG